MSYKILSLDGGGSWAMIQARVLQDIYGDIDGHELLQKFDMAIANSGGSLVLAALCCNMKLSDIVKVFENAGQRKQVFSELTFLEKLKEIAPLLSKKFKIGPKYATSRKLEGLTKVLRDGQQPPLTNEKDKGIVEHYLDELPAIIGKESLQIIIVGFDYFRQRANFFRSNPLSNTGNFSGAFNKITLRHAIHSSSNAPVNYFDKPATITLNQPGGLGEHTTWFWDGAVSGFNNPVLAGVIEAITNGFTTDMNEYRVLSIGTGTGTKAIIADYEGSTNEDTREIYKANIGNPLAETDNSFSFLRDVKELATSILGDPPDSATFMAYAVLHPTLPKLGNIVRINPCMKPDFNAETKQYVYPAVYNNSPEEQQMFRDLLVLDMDAVQDDEVALIKGLCDRFIVDTPHGLANQLIRGQAGAKSLGYDNYFDAKERWNDLDD